MDNWKILISRYIFVGRIDYEWNTFVSNNYHVSSDLFRTSISLEIKKIKKP